MYVIFFLKFFFKLKYNLCIYFFIIIIIIIIIIIYFFIFFLFLKFFFFFTFFFFKKKKKDIFSGLKIIKRIDLLIFLLFKII